MFYGSIVALVTPFRNNLVDFESLEKLIDLHIKSNTDAIVVCGCTGEGALISEKEHFEIIKKSVEISKNRIKIIAGCGTCSTIESIKLVNNAEKLNADGVLVIAPYYVKPTQNGLIEHFKTIHENSNIPIIIYNNPGRCSVNMTIDTILELAKLDRIVALKDSNTDLSRVTILKKENKEFSLLSGDDATLVGYLSHGGDGAISVTANIEPILVKRLIDSYKNQDIKSMQEISQKLACLNELLFIESNPIPIKYILYKKGYIMANEFKLPLTPISKTNQEQIDRLYLNI